MNKAKRARYTLEFKLEAVRLVKAGQSVAAVAATLDVPAQSISNWFKAEQEGKLGGVGTKPVSPEQMELSRLRAEVARLKMERDILKTPVRTSRRTRREVRLYRTQLPSLADFGVMGSARGEPQRLPSTAAACSASLLALLTFASTPLVVP